MDTRGATSLKLSSFELFELFIFELEPSPSLLRLDFGVQLEIGTFAK